MLSYALYLFLLIYILPRIPTTAAAATPAYTSTDFILLNCGASSKLNDTSRRSWDGDYRSRYTPKTAASISSAFTASYLHPSVSQVPYETARVFNSSFTYTFPVLPGPKFLRLYFYPANYSDFDTSQSFFSVTANAYTLLNDFNAFLNSPSSSQPSFMKEFIITIEENQGLVLTFSSHPGQFAFVNGIEIVSIPDKLYYRGDDVPIKFVNQPFYLNKYFALENLYRLNVGGSRVEIQDDSGPNRGMFRAWIPDDDYIYGGNYGCTHHAENLQIKYTSETPPYTAPEIVYTTSRMTANYGKSLEWEFPVDSGFYYLLRLHFCAIDQLEVTGENESVFTNQTMEIKDNVIVWTGGTGIPVFRDFITWVADDGHHGKKGLLLSLFPNIPEHSKYTNAMLNGLEIFKLNDWKRSLAAANPELPPKISRPLAPAAVLKPPDISRPLAPAAALKPPDKKKSPGTSVIYAVTGSVTGVLAVVAAVSFLISRRRRRKVKGSATTSASWILLSNASRPRKRTTGSGVSLPSDLCRYFLLDEIKTATHKFDDNFVIGKGGFGNVYKGLINDGATTVAIKRLNPSSSQGAREFLTEIEMLSKLSHRHLVSLMGYCDEYGEMILVYDYMAHGTLRSHLYNSENPPLTWKQRHQICLGAAKGLHYLHTGAKHAIIHRDVKSTNILLDDKWVAKMSDFGLSKVGPSGEDQTHISTVVKGSFGYVDPEYCRRQQSTDKSDVYSFGVVLFEVLCARPPIIPSLPSEQVNLAEWAKFCYKEGTLEQIIDSNLDGQIAPECLSKFAETAVACLREKGIERPAMRDIVWSLESAMQLQEAAESRGVSVADGDGNGFIAPNVGLELSTS